MFFLCLVRFVVIMRISIWLTILFFPLLPAIIVIIFILSTPSLSTLVRSVAIPGLMPSLSLSHLQEDIQKILQIAYQQMRQYIQNVSYCHEIYEYTSLFIHDQHICQATIQRSYYLFQLFQYLENRMASGELNSHYYAKILAIIRNQNLQNSKQTISQKNFWPAARPSLQTLSNINLLCSKNKVQPKEKAKYQKNKPQRRFTQNMRCKSAVLQFVRPATCNAEPRRSHKNQVKTVKSSDINLFEKVRNQALVKLKTQKQDLMKNIFDQKRIEIHRVNEDEEIMTKENAINFKTYNALNKMMNIQDRIYQTLNYRPKTGESTNKRRLCIH